MARSWNAATIACETLEAWVREQARDMIQQALEEEVTELLGRMKSERRAAVDAPPGYRNGYGKPRPLAMSSGTIEVRRPRVRGLEERFESRVLPLFQRRTREVGELIPELYLHGLAEGDFELALRGLLGDGAPLSKSSVGQLRARWTAEHEAWSRRPLEGHEPVYAWAGGIYVTAGLEKDKAALLVVIGAMSDGTKEVLAVTPGYRESVASWSAVLRDLKARGLVTPRLLVADGNLGIWGAAREVWPEAAEQRCWNHKTTNVLDRLPKREQAVAREMLRAAAYAPSRAAAVRARKAFGARYADTQPQGGVRARGRLGPHDRLLRLSGEALAAPEDDQRRGEPVRLGPAAHDGRQAVQAGRQRHGADLAALGGGREAVPEAQRSRAAAGRVRGKKVRGRKARPRGSGEDRRLMTFTHLLTRPLTPRRRTKAITTGTRVTFGLSGSGICIMEAPD